MTYIHDVPNHLEVEDTFVLGLTVRQCVIVGCGAAMAYGLFNDLFSSIPNPAIGLVVGLVAAFLLFGVLLAVALVRVGGRGLDEWGLVLLVYSLRPKVYLWRFNAPDACELLDQANLERASGARLEKEAIEEW